MQSFIGLPSMVPEILEGSLKTPSWTFKQEKKPGPNRVKKKNQSSFPLTFSSGASLMQSNLDANFLGEIVTSHKLF